MSMTPRDAQMLGSLFEKLAGPQRDAWQKAFHHFMEKDDPWDTRLLVIRPWRTITIGRLKTHDAYFDAIAKAGRNIEPQFTQKMVERTPLLQEEREVELFKLTTAEMALGGSTFYPYVCDRMEKFGLTYCHPEVALALAAEEPAHGVIVVMKGVSAGKGKLGYFDVKWSEGYHWLDSGPITSKEGYLSGGLLGTTQQFVFTEMKKQKE